MKVIYRPEDKALDKLESFVLSHPNGNFFQSAACFRFFYELDGFQPLLILADDGKDSLIGSLLAVVISESGLKRHFTKRTIVTGGPLLSQEADKFNVLQSLLTTLRKSQNSIYVEFRNLFSCDELKTTFHNLGYEYLPHLNYVVTVKESAEASISLLNSSKRRQIRKSLKSGAEIAEAQNIDEVKQLYELIKELYKTKVKKPLADFALFEKFYRDNSLGKIFIIHADQKIVGGIVCPIYKHTIYEWYIVGLDGQIPQVYPSTLATWAPIEFASRNSSLKYFDFLGAGKPDEDYGVRDFKSKFGGELQENGRFLLIQRSLLFLLGKTALALIKKVKR